LKPFSLHPVFFWSRMKFLSAVFAVALACVVSAAFVGKLPFQNTPHDAKFKALVERIKKNVEERGPAVNWTFSSWMSGGPTCVDNTNFTIVDLGKSGFDPALSLIHEALTNFSADYGDVYSFGFGLVYNGQVIDKFFAGHVKVDSNDTAKDDTVISVGSITKMFTSLLMNILAEKGKLKVNDPVTKFFNKDAPPEFKISNPIDPNAGASAVTLESLASQTSGLPRQAMCNGEESCTEDVVMSWVNKFPLFHSPLTRPHYSNVGFDLLGHCCERAAREDGSNVTYEQLIYDNILKTWEMKSSGFDFPDEIKKRMAGGYTFDSDLKPMIADGYATSLNYSNPSGGMYSTTSDMLKFISHLLAKDSVLSPNGFEQYFLPGAILSDGVSSFGKFGWEVAYSNGFRTITKNGVVGGFNSEIALIPELKLGTFVWDNNQQLDSSALSALAHNILVPLVLSELAKVQPKHEAPAVEDFLGDYYVEGVKGFVIGKDDKTDETGIYYGELPTAGMKFWGYYDKQTTLAYGMDGAYFFRLFLILDNACFTYTMKGVDNTVVMFFKNKEKWTVMYMDTPNVLEKKE